MIRLGTDFVDMPLIQTVVERFRDRCEQPVHPPTQQQNVKQNLNFSYGFLHPMSGEKLLSLCAHLLEIAIASVAKIVKDAISSLRNLYNKAALIVAAWRKARKQRFSVSDRNFLQKGKDCFLVCSKLPLRVNFLPDSYHCLP
jgi:hypothetical protein